jgi:hypothetical protein
MFAKENDCCFTTPQLLLVPASDETGHPRRVIVGEMYTQSSQGRYTRLGRSFTRLVRPVASARLLLLLPVHIGSCRSLVSPVPVKQ